MNQSKLRTEIVANQYAAILNAKPVQQDGEGYVHFGTRLLTYLLTHDIFLLGIFDIDALECAHYAVHNALARTVNLGTKDQKEMSPAVVYDRLEDLRRQLGESLTRRRTYLATTLAPFATADTPANGQPGTGVLASSLIPKPKLPSSGVALEPDLLTDIGTRPTRVYRREMTTTNVEDPF